MSTAMAGSFLDRFSQYLYLQSMQNYSYYSSCGVGGSNMLKLQPISSGWIEPEPMI
jgi:hypothetical protein